MTLDLAKDETSDDDKEEEIVNTEEDQRILSSRIKKNHPTELVIGDVLDERKTQSKPKVNY